MRRVINAFSCHKNGPQWVVWHWPVTNIQDQFIYSYFYFINQMRKSYFSVLNVKVRVAKAFWCKQKFMSDCPCTKARIYV